nr:MAG TPA: hypothetical protein [Caudoviricetes sp.]
MKIVRDYIKCVVIEGGAYERGEFAGNMWCRVNENGEFETHEYSLSRLYILDNRKKDGTLGLYKQVEYNGYLRDSAEIVMLDSNLNVLDHIKNTGDGPITNVAFNIPENCRYVYLSCASDYEKNYYLRVFEGDFIDVTQNIENLDSLENVLSRDGVSGVISEVSFEISFVLSAKDFVKDIFFRKGLYGKALLKIYRRGNFDNDYKLIKDINLDFSTYQEYADRVTVEAAKFDLLEIINSEGKTKYEVPVSEISDTKKWKYERMNFINNGVYELVTSDMTVAQITDLIAFSLNLSSSELIPGEGIDFVSQTLTYGKTNYFIQNNGKSVNMHIKMMFKFIFEGEIKVHNPFETEIDKNSLLSIQLYRLSSEGNFKESIKSWFLAPETLSIDGEKYTGIFSDTMNVDKIVTIEPNERICLGFSSVNNMGMAVTIQSGYYRFESLEEGNKPILTAYYTTKSQESHEIDIIDPTTLMQHYLNEMSGVNGLFSVQINWSESNYKTMLIAAESIRQIPGAKLYGSPNDFFDWMKVLGYEYDIDGTKLIFNFRDEYFKSSFAAMSMRKDEIADLIIKADNTYAYTSIEIGYDKQDYDTMNGRCEPNGMFSYTTGYITRTDNKLSLISPYRADSIGIEILCQESDKQTTDTDSDNDVFFVALKENSEDYSEYKDIYIEDKDFSSLKLFNAPFNPYYLIKRNQSLIGINADKVKFKATDMSRTAIIIDNGQSVDPYADQIISKKLFEPIIYNFAAGSNKDLPDHAVRNGLVKINWKDEIYTGFIKEIRKNYASDTETTWELWGFKDRAV